MSSNILGPEWNLSPEGLNTVTQNGAVKDPKIALKNALSSDLKVIGKPALANELSKSQIGKIVLQIQKIRNISAPKAKEESQAAPRMLKLTLTDGETYIQAIEISSINSISREKTAPGTKVLLNGAKVVSGFLLINPQNCTVLGGQVEHLYDKWLLAKSIQQSHQYAKVSNEGAPPWVAFGGKLVTGNQEKPFKSLEKGKEINNDSEFDQQRKDAIAEVSSVAVRKTFGGRVKQNVQPIQNNNYSIRGGKNNDKEYDRGRRGKFAQKNDDDVEKLQRPSEKVSLFSFLEDKLPLPDPKKLVEQKNISTSTSAKQNNQNYQKDNRNQQKYEGSYNKYESRTSNRPQYYDKSAYQKNDKPKTQQSYNSSFSRPSNSNTTSSTNIKNLPQASFNSTSIASSKTTGSENSNSSNKIVDVSNNVNNYAPKYNQHNQYRSNNDRYSQQSNSGQYSKESLNQPSSNFQYHSANNFQPQSNEYNPKPQQNSIQNQSQNAELHLLANNLSKMSVSNEFASRSLRQHLNLGPPKRQEMQGGQNIGPNSLNVGDQCMARYWEDGKFYSATVAAITDKTYAVQFTGYGNIEEVLKHDCFSPANLHNQHNRNQNYSYPQSQFSGSTMEFRSRRGPPRN